MGIFIQSPTTRRVNVNTSTGQLYDVYQGVNNPGLQVMWALTLNMIYFSY
jgi:hypothetical protein